MPFRKREYKSLEDRKYKTFERKAVIELAARPEWSMDKSHALYELATRALDDPSLLPIAWSCIGTEILFKTRSGTPLGHPAAILLVDSKDKTVEATLAKALAEWTKMEQMDFFFGVVLPEQRFALAKRLENDYGLELKVLIYEDGEIDFEP